MFGESIWEMVGRAWGGRLEVYGEGLEKRFEERLEKGSNG